MTIAKPIKTIIIQSPKRFIETSSEFKEVCKFPHYRISDGISSSAAKRTLCGNTCSILGMSNGVDTYVGHYAPEYKKSDFKNKLDYLIKKFQDKSGNNSTAIVTGAYDFSAGTDRLAAKNSFELAADIGEVLDINGVDATFIAAKKIPVFVDNLAVTDNAFILSPKMNRGFNLPVFNIKKSPDKTELDAMLSDKYSIYEPSAEHKISFEA